jgi:ferredoxin
VKVALDREKCVGHGRCYDLAPEVFGSDDEGYSEVLIADEIPESLERVARLAVLNCPENALRIVE